MRLKFKSTKLHTVAAAIWAGMLAPTLLWWNQSILWVAFMSLYANFVGHVSSYEAAASAGVDEATRRKLDAVAEGLADVMEVLSDLLPGDERSSLAAGKLKRDAEELRRAVGLEEKDD